MPPSPADLEPGPRPPASPVHCRRRLRREPVLLVLCVLLLLLATVPPLINLGRFQRRVAVAISRSIGRPVGMDSISLRLLPWPAFQIRNLSVGEAPGFGAEPALRAPEVVAEPRLSSLWRGRFELSRVELTDASVNLVRDADGRWNISSVLLQASHIANAPTAQTLPGPAPRFPYIEATGTRINVKRGDEKLPWSLLNADFSMWLARPEIWQLKLEGQPVRTDLELALSDTGLLHLEGELHRASALGSMPLALTGEWSHAPLGQLSRLLLGHDSSWRGDIDLTADFKGEMDRLDLRTRLKIANLHREEFTPQQPFSLDATCREHYSRSQPSLDGLACRWPVGDGALLLTHAPAQPDQTQPIEPPSQPPSQLRGQLHGSSQSGSSRPGLSQFSSSHAGSSRPGLSQLSSPPNSSASSPPNPGTPPRNGTLTLSADKVPASFLAAALGLLRPGAPAPQRFTGEINGSLAYNLAAGRLTGALAVPELTIADAAADGGPLVLNGVQLAAGAGAQPTLLLTSQPLALGLPARPLALSAELSLKGYSLHAVGGGRLSALDAAASALGLPGLAQISSLPDAPATAELALTRAGPWFSPSPTPGPALESDSGTGPEQTAGDAADRALATGTVHLENARWEPSWLLSPVDLLSADAALSPGLIRWSTPLATIGAGEGRLRFAGNAQAPLHCTGPETADSQAVASDSIGSQKTGSQETASKPGRSAMAATTAATTAMSSPQTACAIRFSLSTPTLDAAAVQTALTGGRQPLLSALLNRFDSTRIHLPALAGSLHIGLLSLGKLPVRDVSMVLATENSAHSGPAIALESLDGAALGGSLHLQGAITLAGSGPRYTLQASVAGASAAQAAALWQESWGPGTLGGTAELTLAGATAPQLLGSIQGSFRASWQHGEMHGGLHGELDGEQRGDLPPALPRFASWDGSGTLSPSGLTLDRSTLSGTPATLTGSIGWDRSLSLVLTAAPDQPPTTITGTLAAPLANPTSTAATP